MITVFLKLGGSLITDKHKEATFRRDECRRLGVEIRAALESSPMQLLLGHGAGSFGHFVAKQFNTAAGFAGGGGWKGYAATRQAVIELNRLVLGAFAEVGFHPLAVAPSSCAVASGGRLRKMDVRAIECLLRHGQVPMVFGDAVPDERRGFTICSTEDIFRCLAKRLRPARVLLACDVDGVFASDPRSSPDALPVPSVTPVNIQAVLKSTRQSCRTDVTGGMAGKLKTLLRIAACREVREVRIFSGMEPQNVQRALLGQYDGGTRLAAPLGYGGTADERR